MLKRTLTLITLLIPTTLLAHIPGLHDASLAPMLKAVTPAVVNITVVKNIKPGQMNPFSQPGAPQPTPPQSGPIPQQPMQPAPQQPLPPGMPPQSLKAMSLGSGVIFDAKHGLIVTNAHVVHNQHLMIVTMKDGRHVRAQMVGEDDGFDIAIIRIPAHNLTAIPFADSDKLKVGDFVAAIGSPFGLTQTVTSGVVSALNRNEPRIEGFQSFIQTDAPINPGNSGGALVNLQGQLVGINTAIVTPIDASIGIGFSIPSNMVKSVIEQLLQYGKVERGMLGVLAQDISPELADAMHLKTTHGSLVTMTVPGSPAALAGIKSKDIITEINGHHIRSSTQLRNTLGLMRPGSTVKLTLIRNHETKTIEAKVGDPKHFKMSHVNPFLVGLSMKRFSETQGDGTELNGVQLTNVADACPGALAGMMPGDVITRANGEAVDSPEALRKASEQSKTGLLLKVYRGDKAIFLVVEP